MTPTYEELLQGSTRWYFSHKGVRFMLSHHAHRTGEEYEGASPTPGIWCYYLLIEQSMFPKRWEDFGCQMNEETGSYSLGPAWKHEWFDSEITYQSSEPYFSLDEKSMSDVAKVGCDYGHSWHDEMGYPDTMRSVKDDATMTVDKFIEANPDRSFKSGWSNKWGQKEEFYTAINGALVHKDDVIPEEYKKWKPENTND